MDERLFLRVALLTALIGTACLAFIPEIPAQQRYATLVWTNETAGLIEYTQTAWIQSDAPIILETPQCVRVEGVVSSERMTNVLLSSVRQSDRHRCP